MLATLPLKDMNTLVEHGTSTLEIEVINISSHGIWLYVIDR